MYQVTKNPNKNGERGVTIYIGKKTVKTWQSFRKIRFRNGLFDLGNFSQSLGVVAYKFPTKNQNDFMAV